MGGTISMDEGFILSNKYRKQVFIALASGEHDLKWIVKKHRLPLNICRHIVEELRTGGLVAEKNGKYFLTNEGEKIASFIV